MTTSFDIERELRRIGVDGRALGGIVTSGDITRNDLLTWLRNMPTGLGHRAFMERSRTDGPRAGLAASGVPPRDVTFKTPDIDLQEEFHAQIDRVLPRDLRPGGWAIIEELDYAEAVEKLRLLPDRAGWSALQQAIPAVEVVADDQPDPRATPERSRRNPP